jgi:hypothetical protein
MSLGEPTPAQRAALQDQAGNRSGSSSQGQGPNGQNRSNSASNKDGDSSGGRAGSASSGAAAGAGLGAQAAQAGPAGEEGAGDVVTVIYEDGTAYDIGTSDNPGSAPVKPDTPIVGIGVGVKS